MNELMNELTYIVNLILNWPAKAKKKCFKLTISIKYKIYQFWKTKIIFVISQKTFNCTL